MSPGFPRIRKRLGAIGIPLFQSTPTVSTQEDYDRCLVIFTRLVDDKEVDVLRAIMDGTVSWGELLYLDRRGELIGTKILARLKLNKPLWKAIEETLPSMGRADATRNAYKWSLLALQRQAIVPWPAEPMLVSDLVTLQWNALEQKWPNSAADYNHMVRAVRAFLTKYLGSPHHEYRQEFGKLVRLLPEDERVPDLTPELFGEIVNELPKAAQIVSICLLLTGFRDRSEYFAGDENDLLPRTCQVEVPGKRVKTKRGRRVSIDEELWPWIEAGFPAPIGYLQFLRYWRRACVAVGAARYVRTGKMKLVRQKLERGQNYVRKGHRKAGQREREPQMVEVPQLRYVGLRPHDLRHALGQWTHEEGRSLVQIKNVLGHRSTRTTERYADSVSRGEVAATIGDIVKKRVLNK